jgi:hypothetical protein
MPSQRYAHPFHVPAPVTFSRLRGRSRPQTFLELVQLYPRVDSISLARPSPMQSTLQATAMNFGHLKTAQHAIARIEDLYTQSCTRCRWPTTSWTAGKLT